MKIHQFLKIGSSHQNHCEDYLISNNQHDKYYFATVFDGCSSGDESWFASAFFGKIILKAYKKNARNNYSNSNLLYNILHDFAFSLKKCIKDLNMDINQLLSTIIILIYNKNQDNGLVIAIGDGIIQINKNCYIIDQNNEPDYIAYHINKITDEQSFKKWFEKQNQIFKFSKLKNVAISTDGLQSYCKTEKSNYEKPSELEIINYYLSDNFLIDNKAMMARKSNILKLKHKIINYDDLGIIRVIN